MNSSSSASSKPSSSSTSSSSAAKGIASVVASIFPDPSRKTLPASVTFDVIAKKIDKARSDRVTADKVAAQGAAYKSGGTARPGSLTLAQAMAIEVARDYKLTTAAALAAQAERDKATDSRALTKRRRSMYLRTLTRSMPKSCDVESDVAEVSWSTSQRRSF